MRLKVFVVALVVALVSSCGSDGKKEEKIPNVVDFLNLMSKILNNVA